MKLKKLLPHFLYKRHIVVVAYRNKDASKYPFYDVTSKTFRSLPEWVLNSYVLTIEKGDYLDADFVIDCRDKKKEGVGE